jgi:tellurite methyltransferase
VRHDRVPAEGVEGNDEPAAAAEVGADDPRTRWNARHAARPLVGTPARFLTDRSPLVPTSGRALDVAGGAGRNAIWLARHGLQVTLVDVSDVACDRAASLALTHRIDLEVLRADIGSAGLPDGPWDVVLMHHFLDRALLRSACDQLRPGGLLLLCQPTVRNLERHARPSRRWLLREGELARLVADLDGMEIVELTEGWTADGRHEAQLILRSRRQLAG